MNFSIRIERSTFKKLSKIPTKDRLQIIEAIDKLKEQPVLGKKILGKWSGLRRVKVGNYRVIYGIKEKELLVLVVRIGHRQDVYR